MGHFYTISCHGRNGFYTNSDKFLGRCFLTLLNCTHFTRNLTWRTENSSELIDDKTCFQNCWLNNAIRLDYFCCCFSLVLGNTPRFIRNLDALFLGFTQKINSCCLLTFSLCRICVFGMSTQNQEPLLSIFFLNILMSSAPMWFNS